MTSNSSAPYSGSVEHLLDNLRVLNSRLQSQIERMERDSNGMANAGLHGLVITREELMSGLFEVDSEDKSTTLSAEFETLLAELESQVEARTARTLDAGVELRLESLRQKFQLNRFEVDVLILCLAPEINTHYETLYAYIQNDIGKKQPTLDLALNLFCRNIEERMERRNFLASKSQLIAKQIVRLSSRTEEQTISLGSFLTLENRVTNYLLGADATDERLNGIVRRVRPRKSLNDLIFSPEFMGRMESLANLLSESVENGNSSVIQLVGAKGTGRKAIAEVICNRLGFESLVVDSARMSSSEMAAEQLVRLILREAILQNAIACFDNFDTVTGKGSEPKPAFEQLCRAVRESGSLVMIGMESPCHPGGELQGCSILELQVPRPDYYERRQLWDAFLNGSKGQLDDNDVDLLARKFRLKGGQIQQVVATAKSYSWLRDSSPDITVDDLNSAARRHSDQRIGDSAQKIQPRYEWDDIVLPNDQKAQLREACSYFVNMALVYEGWGFQRKTSLGKGLNILFAGQSGTGKTMAADIMAGELGLDLYKIDLSGIVSKYIGETEKNLDRIFGEAQDSNAILFFDEADALFGKRSEVKDSHDRYANIETSYLLQKMEEYQGIVILATNFRKNMDDAFVRRMHFAIEFPVPEEEDRFEIWSRVFPAEAPLGEDVDLKFLARQFKVAGGNIKNIAVNSAFLAAGDGQLITMEHVILSTKREYQKMGKLLIENDFGKYFEIVKSSHLVRGA